ncbi:MFS transporter [uncultured Faecalibaculum sp.]|uniref:MFS transporter n=2 Tax=uncultured Faecalibaculum sp. TaxID=1729681 RepID=UPI00260B976A|nr:MFS transporter [uncultured Faecalibaculum sp.]
MNENTLTSKYKPLLISAGLGSILGSGIIVSLAGTITVWQNVLNLSASQVGLISSLLTLSIAAGSLLAGKITRSLGLIRSFNILNVFFIIGTLLIMTAQNFWMLMAGTVIAGFFSGADLPVSLTMISHDAPNEKISAELVSGTQVYWTIGILLATLSAFATSTLPGAWSPRICTAIVTLVAVLAVWMRNGSAKIRDLHAQAPKREQPEDGEKVSVVKLLFGRQTKPYLGFFLCILIFYCGWNLLANTFGQFQTYMLVKANASQTFATGAGVILTIVCLVVAQIFSKIAGGKNRNVAFVIGVIIMVAALVGLAFSGSSLWLIVAWIALQNVGSTFAGEAMYKVWTQESFPAAYRSGIQGFINGFSRLCCAAFALITPVLVLPEHIRTTMLGFAALILVSGIVGMVQIRLQKKYNVGSND